ncbi:MAG: anti-sigma factor antagonist [Nitrospirae bacterium]|nr:MAG: anti-sigma factor antagonist [Nitrospirota bacterium]
MEIKIGMDGDFVIAELSGDLVAGTAEQFKSQMTKLMEKNFLNVVLELSKVNFMDSSGLGACMAAHKAFAEKKGTLVCTKPSETVAKVFRVTRADQKLNMAGTRTEAVMFLQNAVQSGRQS